MRCSRTIGSVLSVCQRAFGYRPVALQWVNHPSWPLFNVKWWISRTALPLAVTLASTVLTATNREPRVVHRHG